MSTVRKLGLKLVYKDELRKATYLPSEIAQLESIISETYSIKSFKYHYIDEDNDKITFKTDEELTDAYEFAKSLKQISMKVYIDDAPEPTPVVAPKENLCTKLEDAICSRMRGAFGPQRGPGFMRNAIQTIVREELSTCKGNSTSSVVHLGYTCDGCGMAPITGIRYRCITCVDYNFCEACESSAVHPHPFVKLTSSEPEDKCAMYAGTFSSNSPIAAEWASGILRKKYIDHSKPRIEILGTTKLAKNLTPGSDYVKVWKIQNVGRISIPKGTSLLTVKGFSKHTVQPLEMDLKPGDMTDITLNFESAGSKGRYVNIFKLHTPTGDKIGARFRVKYKVD